MKKNNFILLLIAIINFSCINENSRKNAPSQMKKVTEKPDYNSLIGNWEVDEFSYDFVKNNYDFKGKKIELFINKDNTFTLKNIFDFDNELKEKNVVFDVNGEWELQHYKNREWRMHLNFNKNFGLANTSFLYMKGNVLVILNFIGDPDSGNRLLFKKNN